MCFLVVGGGREKCINEEKSLCIFIYFNAVFPPAAHAASNMSIASRPKLGRNSLFFTHFL